MNKESVKINITFLNQYRLSSVNECQVVEGIKLKKVEDEE